MKEELDAKSEVPRQGGERGLPNGLDYRIKLVERMDLGTRSSPPLQNQNVGVDDALLFVNFIKKVSKNKAAVVGYGPCVARTSPEKDDQLGGADMRGDCAMDAKPTSGDGPKGDIMTVERHEPDTALESYERMKEGIQQPCKRMGKVYESKDMVLLGRDLTMNCKNLALDSQKVYSYNQQFRGPQVRLRNELYLKDSLLFRNRPGTHVRGAYNSDTSSSESESSTGTARSYKEFDSMKNNLFNKNPEIYSKYYNNEPKIGLEDRKTKYLKVENRQVGYSKGGSLAAGQTKYGHPKNNTAIRNQKNLNAFATVNATRKQNEAVPIVVRAKRATDRNSINNNGNDNDTNPSDASQVTRP